MTASTDVCKRLRPLLGTFFEIQVPGVADGNALVTAAFAEAGRLEKIFSRFLPESDVFRYHEAGFGEDLNLSREFERVLSLALEFKRDSQSAFDPFWRGVRDLDLNGLAKGFIVDQVAEFIMNFSVTASGSVNAGGDLRVVRGPAENEFTLRLGSASQPKLRKISSAYNCVASSSLGIARDRRGSSTQYSAAPHRGMSPEHTIVVLSNSAVTADALTKVGLFAEASVIEFCSLRWNSKILIFNPAGDLVEAFSNHEIQPTF
jgi:thiamine biosynthesis lipoprotein ApbE